MRALLAYALIAVLAIVAIAGLAIYIPHRRREKKRRRGIKNYSRRPSRQDATQRGR